MPYRQYNVYILVNKSVQVIVHISTLYNNDPYDVYTVFDSLRQSISQKISEKYSIPIDTLQIQHPIEYQSATRDSLYWHITFP